jgi:hypothetical protein
MARQVGAIDARLLDVRAVTGEVLAAVLTEHDCSGTACTACGYVPTRRQAVCRSVAVAKGMRVGRAPSWAGPVEPALSVRDVAGEQGELFTPPARMRKGTRR